MKTVTKRMAKKLAQALREFMLEHTVNNCPEWRTGEVCQCANCRTAQQAIDELEVK